MRLSCTISKLYENKREAHLGAAVAVKANTGMFGRRLLKEESFRQLGLSYVQNDEIKGSKNQEKSQPNKTNQNESGK